MTTIDLMWEKFAEHQPEADKRGYGEAWHRMCEERTMETADMAAETADAVAGAWAAEAAAWYAARAAAWAARAAADAAANAECWAEYAIECINKAEENK